MAASLETIREKMKVEPTRDDKGLNLTLIITAYDNGMVSVNGRPVERPDRAATWLYANEVIAINLAEFYQQFLARQKSKPTPKV
jgi:hypothetical protein